MLDCYKSQIKPMPKGDWKKDLKFGSVPDMPKKSSSPEGEKTKKPLNPIGKKGREKLANGEPLIKKTPIKRVGEKRKNRIKQEGSEVKSHLQIFYLRAKVCEVCGKKIDITEKQVIEHKKTWCFAHKLSKQFYPRLRLILENYAYVCSINCHNDYDKKMTLEKRKELEQELNKKYNLKSKIG